MAVKPLIITDDGAMLDDLLRVAAAAGVDVEHAREPESRALWRASPVVMLDAALVGRAVDASLARRSGVVVVTSGTPHAELWELCVRLGADRTVVLQDSEEELIELLS